MPPRVRSRHDATENNRNRVLVLTIPDATSRIPDMETAISPATNDTYTAAVIRMLQDKIREIARPGIYGRVTVEVKIINGRIEMVDVAAGVTVKI